MWTKFPPPFKIWYPGVKLNVFIACKKYFLKTEVVIWEGGNRPCNKIWIFMHSCRTPGIHARGKRHFLSSKSTHHLGHFPLTFQTLCLVIFMYYQIKFWNLDIPVFRYRIQDKCGYLHVFLWSSLQGIIPFFERMFTVWWSKSRAWAHFESLAPAHLLKI